MHITVYSTGSCQYCIMLKKYLDEKNVAYTDIRVDLDQEAAAEMFQKSGQLGVPFSIIQKEDGEEVGILGFDIPRFNSFLDIA